MLSKKALAEAEEDWLAENVASRSADERVITAIR
jgi:hypothetical protein